MSQTLDNIVSQIRQLPEDDQRQLFGRIAGPVAVSGIAMGQASGLANLAGSAPSGVQCPHCGVELPGSLVSAIANSARKDRPIGMLGNIY
jgi:hypothetical protein